jgi:hypothetical protein
MTEWRGTNAFRMMPTDEFWSGPCTATTVQGAGGQRWLVTYTWEHPEDGPQDGVLLVGSAAEGERDVSAVFGDSWHQHPGLMRFAGTASGGRVDLAGEYGGGWGWQIALDVGETLTMTMSNVIPEEYATPEAAAGPYPVMVAELQTEP